MNMKPLQYRQPDIGPLPRPMACPCCGTETRTPSLDVVIDNLEIRPREAKVLRAVWKGKGHPVPKSRICDAMYADDPDGGPANSTMNLTFKVALCLLRKKLEGSGIAIETVGSRRGYRLKIME